MPLLNNIPASRAAVSARTSASTLVYSTLFELVKRLEQAVGSNDYASFKEAYGDLVATVAANGL